MQKSFRKNNVQSLYKRAGFTLIEVMVAVAFVGLAIPALMLLMGQQANSTANIRNQLIATWIADNKATQLRLERKLNDSVLRSPEEETIKMAGTDWFVIASPEQTELGALLKYTIAVSLEQDKPLATIETFVN